MERKQTKQLDISLEKKTVLCDSPSHLLGSDGCFGYSYHQIKLWTKQSDWVKQSNHHMRWEARAWPNCPPVSVRVANGARWHSKHLCRRTTGGKAPETCLHQPLLNCGSKRTALIGMACSCYSEGGSSATPLMSTTVSKAGEPLSLLSVSHLDRDFSILERDFLKWSRQRPDFHGLDSSAPRSSLAALQRSSKLGTTC